MTIFYDPDLIEVHGVRTDVPYIRTPMPDGQLLFVVLDCLVNRTVADVSDKAALAVTLESHARGFYCDLAFYYVPTDKLSQCVGETRRPSRLVKALKTAVKL